MISASSSAVGARKTKGKTTRSPPDPGDRMGREIPGPICEDREGTKPTPTRLPGDRDVTRRRRLVGLALCLALTIPARARAEDSPPGEADVIFRLGRVWTGDIAKPWAESIASRSGELI